jgi:hypothetical protein
MAMFARSEGDDVSLMGMLTERVDMLGRIIAQQQAITENQVSQEDDDDEETVNSSSDSSESTVVGPEMEETTYSDIVG